MDTSRRTPLWVHSIRALLGIVFFSAGASKLVEGFPSIIGPVWLIERLDRYGLAFFAQFVAVSELLTGLLLLIPQLATLGAIMLVPMLTCILAVVISLGWHGTPQVITIFLLLNCALLWYDYPRWRSIILESATAEPRQPHQSIWHQMRPGWLGALAVLLASPMFARVVSGMIHLLILCVVIAGALHLSELRRGKWSGARA